MEFLKNIFGNKTEKVEQTKPKSTEYFIDFDPNLNSFSTAFKDFYKNHFIDAYGMTRGDVDTYFFNAMTADEKNEESIEMLFDYLMDKSGLVKSMALSKLNYLTTGKYELNPKHDRQYFITKRDDINFKNELLLNLKKLDWHRNASL